MRKSKDYKRTADMVDKTIESICKEIQSNDMLSCENYANTVKALARLIEARAELVRSFDR